MSVSKVASREIEVGINTSLGAVIGTVDGLGMGLVFLLMSSFKP